MNEGTKIFFWVWRMFLGAFFVWSGIVKLLDLSAFTEAVANYQMIPRPYDAWVAYLLPWAEVFAGMALLVGFFVDGALLCVAGMMLVFVGALSYAWSQGLNINCGCFGASDDPVNYPWKIASNVGILLLAIVLWLPEGRLKKNV